MYTGNGEYDNGNEDNTMDDEPMDDAFKNIIMVNMNINNDDTQSISTIDNNYKNKYINKNINVYQILELNKEKATLTQTISSSSKNIPIPPPANLNESDKMYLFYNNFIINYKNGKHNIDALILLTSYAQELSNDKLNNIFVVIKQNLI